MARTYEFTVGAGEAGLRLDHYLMRHLPAAVSRSRVQQGIRDGLITVGGKAARAHERVRASAVIIAKFDELPAPSRGTEVTAQPIPLDIVFEDAHLLVVNKPAGLVTHPAPGHWQGTLVNALAWHFKDAQVLPRAGIVHRLDKDTSGLLLVAKTAEAHTLLAKQLKSRLMKRRYLALVEGHVPLDTGTVSAAIGRHPTHRKQMSVRHLGGRSAVTHYRVLRRFGARGSGFVARALPYTLLEVSLETGRTHQIRVHMAHLGHPVLGDATYGKRPPGYWQRLGIARQMLHAAELRLRHPKGGRELVFSAPQPQDMRGWIAGRPS